MYICIYIFKTQFLTTNTCVVMNLRLPLNSRNWFGISSPHLCDGWRRLISSSITDFVRHRVINFRSGDLLPYTWSDRRNSQIQQYNLNSQRNYSKRVSFEVIPINRNFDVAFDRFIILLSILTAYISVDNMYRRSSRFEPSSKLRFRKSIARLINNSRREIH